jgi:hypothetical protein
MGCGIIKDDKFGELGLVTECLPRRQRNPETNLKVDTEYSTSIYSNSLSSYIMWVCVIHMFLTADMSLYISTNVDMKFAHKISIVCFFV